MSDRLVRAILALYPREFRRRYGPEVKDLVNDLEAAGDRSRLRLVGGLLVSAAAERLRAVRLDARLAIHTLAAAAALGTIVGVTSSPGGRHLARTVAAALPPTTSITPPARVKLPTGGRPIAVSGSADMSAPTFAGSTPTSPDTSATTGSASPSAASTLTAAQGTASTASTSTAAGGAGLSASVPPVVGSTTVTPRTSSSPGTADTPAVTPGQ
jgi:hypothetical protein